MNVFILIGFEKLGLSVFVLFILRLVVTKLAIKLVKSIFLFLDDLVALLDFHRGSNDGLFFGTQKSLNILNSLVIIFDFSSKN